MREYVSRIRDLFSDDDASSDTDAEPETAPSYTVDRDELPTITVREFYEQIESEDVDPESYLSKVNEEVAAYLHTHLGMDVEVKDVHFDPDLDTVAKYRKHADPPSQPQDVILFGRPSDMSPWQEDQQLISVLAHEYVHVNQLENRPFSGTYTDREEKEVAQETVADFIITYLEDALDHERDAFLEKTRNHYREQQQEEVADRLEQLMNTYDSISGSSEERVEEILHHQPDYLQAQNGDDESEK